MISAAAASAIAQKQRTGNNSDTFERKPMSDFFTILQIAGKMAAALTNYQNRTKTNFRGKAPDVIAYAAAVILAEDLKARNPGIEQIAGVDLPST